MDLRKFDVTKNGKKEEIDPKVEDHILSTILAQSPKSQM